MIHLGHTSTKALFFLRMKFRFNWMSYVWSSNSLPGWHEYPPLCCGFWPQGDGVAGREMHGAASLPPRGSVTLSGIALFLFTSVMLPPCLPGTRPLPVNTHLSQGGLHFGLAHIQLFAGRPLGSAGHTGLIWGYFDSANVHILSAVSSQVNFWWKFFPECASAQVSYVFLERR